MCRTAESDCLGAHLWLSIIIVAENIAKPLSGKFSADTTYFGDEGGMAKFGCIQEFQPESETITAYFEWLEMFYAANDVEEDKQVPVLLSVVGMKIYSLLCSLLAPKSPKEEAFANLERDLKLHFESLLLVIAERFHFYQWRQAAAESLSDYVTELWRSSATCEFGDFLNDALCDRFVCGLPNEVVTIAVRVEIDLH